MKGTINSKNTRYWVIPILLFSIITLGSFVCINMEAQNTIIHGKKSKQPKSKTNKQAMVSSPTGYVNGHGYVDLGLPSGTKWATCNIGAEKPTDYGSYFAWGELISKSDYTESNCKTLNIDIDDISGNPSYDVACCKWGKNWKIPTKQECLELISECKWKRGNLKGVNGYKFTGPNGNTIFLPFCGYFLDGKYFNHAQCYMRYWSSTPTTRNEDAWTFLLTGASDYTLPNPRYWGCSVRAVTN